MKKIVQKYITLNKKTKIKLIPVYLIISLFLFFSIYSYILMPKLTEIVDIYKWDTVSYFSYNITILFKENIFYIGLTILSFIFLTYNKKLNIQE